MIRKVLAGTAQMDNSVSVLTTARMYQQRRLLHGHRRLLQLESLQPCFETLTLAPHPLPTHPDTKHGKRQRNGSSQQDPPLAGDLQSFVAKVEQVGGDYRADERAGQEQHGDCCDGDHRG